MQSRRTAPRSKCTKKFLGRYDEQLFYVLCRSTGLGNSLRPGVGSRFQLRRRQHHGCRLSNSVEAPRKGAEHELVSRSLEKVCGV